jgi:hypothetical protein
LRRRKEFDGERNIILHDDTVGKLVDFADIHGCYGCSKSLHFGILF